MDLGIINLILHKVLVNYILEAIQENLLTSSSTVKEVSTKIHSLQTAQFIADSWQRVSTKTIQNCFAFCGFKHLYLEMPSKADSENYVILDMHRIGNYKMLSCLDHSLQCYNENEDCDKAIVEKIAVKDQKTSDQGTDEDDMTKY
jgi:hypothetical protein